MLGLAPIEEIGMLLEDGFKAAKEGKPVLTPDNLLAVQGAINGMEKLIDQLATHGTVEGFDVSAILQKLQAFK